LELINFLESRHTFERFLRHTRPACSLELAENVASYVVDGDTGTGLLVSAQLKGKGVGRLACGPSSGVPVA
jgi:hypothetical protein